MHQYTTAILTACAACAVFWIAHEISEHRKRKAQARKAAAHEAVLTRAIEKALLQATRARAAERLQEQQRAQHRAALDAIEQQYHGQQ
jgi:nitrate/TMAO reductase-like tetraheme cytochrome c subunit